MSFGSLTSMNGKDPARELALAKMNVMLEPLQATLEAGLTAPAAPPVLILGPPRGGTTLMSQLIQSSGLFGTVTNFVARFWRAPSVGLKIQDALGLTETRSASSYRSVRGVTEGWGEPSEFGYFWSHYFDLGQSTHLLGAAERERLDRQGLRRAIASMEAVANKPMAFKNNTWFSFHADILAEMFPGAVIVVCRRDPFFVAQSLYLQRLDLGGDVTRWWSVRPPEYDVIRQLSPVDQVAQQAVRIGEHMEASVRRAVGAVVVDASYERLVANPRGVVEEICAAAGMVLRSAALAGVPERFESTNTIRLDPAVVRGLEAAISSVKVTTR